MHLPPEILPVLDLKQGQVVHAVAGQRENYQPLVSRWTPAAHDPLELTKALSTHLGLREFYVADLDAIEHQASEHQLIIQELLERGFSLCLDAGITRLDEVQRYLNIGVQQMIISSESLPELSLLLQAVQQFGPEQIVFSLDLKDGQICGLNKMMNRDPQGVLLFAIEHAINQFILLDIARVGTQKGPTMSDWCKKLKAMKPDCRIISGGGIRNYSDIKLLLDAGADRVLVSTWLHSNTHC